MKLLLLFLSIVCVLWGGLISFSDEYFAYWQNTYWKEAKRNQWSNRSRTVNRYGTGLGAFLFGIALGYLVLFDPS